MSEDESGESPATIGSRPYLLDPKLASRWRPYALQVSAATVYLVAALLLVRELGNLAVVSAIAASAFLVFCMPASVMSQPRRVFGGHILAILVTLAMSPFIHDPVAPSLLDNAASSDAVAALSVGMTMFLMAATDSEHAPAAGTALGLSLDPWSIDAAASVIVMVLLLLVVAAAGRARLVSLV